ncbi:hypothetical protein F5X68DRAFT_212289, partial [Plectosphaerella plurivora]
MLPMAAVLSLLAGPSIQTDEDHALGPCDATKDKATSHRLAHRMKDRSRWVPFASKFSTWTWATPRHTPGHDDKLDL